ncbi:MAG: hypothetical protein JO258_07325 [Alphaproteobacteria bacterium]|nr:hypothetical protein [Alphaproteobacteria bacterium]
MSDTALLFRSIRAARAWVQSGTVEAAASAACVTMKPGGGAPPLFLIPGAAGSILQLAPLAEAIPAAGPVYAIKPRGLEPGEIPCAALSEMAEHAVDIMTKAWPAGPYLLAGYSAGGLVALEAARQLAAEGRRVPLVVLLDTYPSRAVWPLRCHVEILLGQTLRACWALRRCSPRQLAAELNRRLRSLLHYLAASGVRLASSPEIVAEGTDAASRRVHLATYTAGEAHRPSRYAGKVVFLQPHEVPHLEPRRPERVWRRFLDDLAIRRVPGTHLGMLQDDAAAAGAEIGRCLAEFADA